MELEKKKMYMVWTLEPDSACTVYAYVENGKVVSYHLEGDGEIQAPQSHERFFNSLQEAESFMSERTKELKGMARGVREILSDLCMYQAGNDGKMGVSLDDFIPYNVKEHYETEAKAKSKRLIKVLSSAARTRTIEVGGFTVNLDKVQMIEWSNDMRAAIWLDEGTRVMVDDYDEYKILENLYEHKRNR